MMRTARGCLAASPEVETLQSHPVLVRSRSASCLPALMAPAEPTSTIIRVSGRSRNWPCPRLHVRRLRDQGERGLIVARRPAGQCCQQDTTNRNHQEHGRFHGRCSSGPWTGRDVVLRLRRDSPIFAGAKIGTVPMGVTRLRRQPMLTRRSRRGYTHNVGRTCRVRSAFRCPQGPQDRRYPPNRHARSLCRGGRLVAAGLHQRS